MSKAVVTEEDVRRLVDALAKEQQQTAALRAQLARIKTRWETRPALPRPRGQNDVDLERLYGEMNALLADAGQEKKEHSCQHGVICVPEARR